MVVEGPEGSGKSTLAGALAERMRQRGIKPVVVREPGSTPAAERVREYFLDPGRQVDPAYEVLLLTSARSDLVKNVIVPALDAGRVVLSDRYDLSTHAYQGAGLGVTPDVIRQHNQLATGGLRPDLTLVLDVPPEVGRSRQASASKVLDRMEREGPEFHARVAAAYLAAAGPGVRHLDGMLPPTELVDAAWSILATDRPALFGRVRG